MEKIIKAKFWGIFLAIVGIVIAIGSATAAVNNWESHAEITLSYPANTSSKTSSYYGLAGNLDVKIVQTEGDSNCKYSIYSQKRSASTWTTVKTALTFAENNSWDGTTYDLQTDQFLDVRIKGNKTAGTKVSSSLNVSIGVVGE